MQKIAPYNNFLKKLVSVHIAYDAVKAHIQQFHQLISLEPGIIEVLTATVPYPASEMVSPLRNCFVKFVHAYMYVCWLAFLNKCFTMET